VLLLANLAATVLRFVLLREWVFSARRPAPHLTVQDVETRP
jgi:putative flippase GtrA